MLKVIWASDLHFTSEGNVLGYDPRVRLGAMVEHINAYHSDADFCIVSGDMVNRGSRQDYDGLASYLGQLSIKILPMMGNHDHRGQMRETFSVPQSCMPDFIQYSVSTPEGLIACLDTQKTGSDAGEFCDMRRDWLMDTLQKAKSQHVYLFMHHPPHCLDLPMQDQDRMENGDAFLDLVSSFDCVKYLFMGHVHRPISGLVGGLPFSTMRSVLYQAPAPRPEWDWETFKPATESPSIGVISIKAGSINLHYEEICDHGTGGP